jgi:hypothetical protein
MLLLCDYVVLNLCYIVCVSACRAKKFSKNKLRKRREGRGWVGVGGNFVENFSQVPTQGWILIEWPIKARG